MLETVRVQHPHAPRVLIRLRAALSRDRALEGGRRRAGAVSARRCRPTRRPPNANASCSSAIRRRSALSDPDDRVDGARRRRADRPRVRSRAGQPRRRAGRGRAAPTRRTSSGKRRSSSSRAWSSSSACWRTTAARAHSAASLLLGKYRDQLDADSVHLLLARVALGDGDRRRAPAPSSHAVRKQDTPTVQRTLGGDPAPRAASTKTPGGAAARPTVSAPAPPTTTASSAAASARAWAGYCEGCERWDTYRSGSEL